MKKINSIAQNISQNSPIRINNLDKVKRIKVPKIPINFNRGVIIKLLAALFGLLVVVTVLLYLLIVRPLLTLANDAKELKFSLYQVQSGLREQNFTEVSKGLEKTQENLDTFRASYEKNTKILRKIPGGEAYYEDGNHFINVAEEGVGLGRLTIRILEPYATDIGFKTDGGMVSAMPAEERIVKLLSLMPKFSSDVKEISDRMVVIDKELSSVDPKRYPTHLPEFVSKFGVDPDINIRQQVESAQVVSRDLATKAPQFERLFNALPEFMGLEEPKRYLVLMANNYELRMSGGFNTYVVVAEFNNGIPKITYAIDTYFIDEGSRTGSSILVNRNVPYFLRNYLYLSGNKYRLYARDATSTSPDFPTAADTFLNEFWYKDWSLPRELDGVIQINNDVVVNLLKVVGPVSTQKYSIKTDQGRYITIPVTEFNSDNAIVELENIAGGKLAETIARKDIIKFLAQSLFDKIFTSETTNLLNIARVGLDSLGRKDVMMYSFDEPVQKAFEALGYAGRIEETPDDGWDYLHVNRSNFGAGKADWTKPGFVTQNVEKNTTLQDGKKISVVKVTINNPKRPSWYNIDPCCFYNAYLRVYVPKGSKLISVKASDGQDAHGAEFVDDVLNKTYFESFTRQPKESTLTVTFSYELPKTVDVDNYKILIQKQPGVTADTYSIGVGGITKKLSLASDTVLKFK